MLLSQLFVLLGLIIEASSALCEHLLHVFYLILLLKRFLFFLLPKGHSSRIILAVGLLKPLGSPSNRVPPQLFKCFFFLFVGPSILAVLIRSSFSDAVPENFKKTVVNQYLKDGACVLLQKSRVPVGSNSVNVWLNMTVFEVCHSSALTQPTWSNYMTQCPDDLTEHHWIWCLDD